jgi:penicillin amidase
MRRLLLASLFVVLLVLGVGRLYLVRDDAGPEGALSLPGLKHPVKVLRDDQGIPHIFAEDSEDLALAFGFTEARDRLWQLDLNRHLLTGTLASAVGARAVPTDLFFRTIGLDKAAQKALEVASPEARAELQAFAKGVNLYARLRPQGLPVEFALTNHPFEPLDPADCAGTGILLAWELADNLKDELLALKLQGVLGPTFLPALFPEAPETFLPGEAGGDPRVEVPPAPKAKGDPPLAGLAPGEVPDLHEALSPLPRPGAAASNNWVVGGERSVSGKPLFANDPHLALGIPSIWYEVHLSSPGLDVVGAAVPGLPWVEIGHNRRIAFGFTNVMADTQDLFVEEVNPENPNQVRFEGEWQDIRREKILIPVKGSAPAEREIRYTRHGPLLNDVRPGLPKAAALAWTVHHWVGGADGFRGLDRAGNWEDVRAAARALSETSLNLVYGDTDGNIGWQVTGSIPLRAKGDGRFPVPGWTGEYEWTGRVPFEDLPSYYLPAGGAPAVTGGKGKEPPTHVIVTANQRSVREDYPYHLSSSWGAPYRFLRISSLLSGSERLSLDDLQRVQSDRHPLLWDVLRPLLDEAQTVRPALSGVIQRLKAWDGQTTADSPGAALFELTLLHLQEEAFKDEVGPLFPGFATRFGSYYAAMDAVLQDAGSPFWDDTRTPEKETRAEILARALEAAVREGRSRLGDDLSAWRWGALHHVVFHHALAREGGALGLLLNRSLPYGGDFNTINNGSWDPGRPFDLVWGSSYRLLVDLADPAHARAMNSTGESGRPMTRHYDDMVRPWAEVRYHTLWTEESDILAHLESTLTLNPSPSGSLKGP